MTEDRPPTASPRRGFLTWLFAPPGNPGSLVAVVAWWEVRRLPYNPIVGAVALPCLAVFLVALITSGQLGPGEDAVEPLALLAAPVAANVFYTLGWLVETIVRSLDRDVSPRFGPRLLKLGLAFSVLLCGLPAAFWSGYRALQWAGLVN